MPEIPDQNDDIFKAPDSTITDAILTHSSKLSPEQQVFVSTAEFQEWFGRSEIVDPETGEPIVYYHGTNRQFDKPIHPANIGGLSNHGIDIDSAGIFLSDSPDFVKQYADPLGSDYAILGMLELLSATTENGTFAERAVAWNNILQSSIEDDGSIKFSKDKDGPRLEQSELEAAIKSGDLNHGSFVIYKDYTVGLLGEWLQLLSGRFPTRSDELVEYDSLHSEVQDKVVVPLRENGYGLKIPKYAQSRIVPFFVKSINPQHRKINIHNLSDVDTEFARAIKAHNDGASVDAVVVSTDGAIIGTGTHVLVFDPEKQLLEAPAA